jgi:hypothetical protein
MTLYQKYETDNAYKYLQQIIDLLEEPICLLGGWAVFFTVNELYKKETGSDYLGSKYIDLGFHIDMNFKEQQLKNTTMGKTISLLEKNVFQSQGSRYYKDLSIENGRELTVEESKKEPAHNVFKMYIDLMVDNVHPSFRKIFKFGPLDEDLLNLVFEKTTMRTELITFKKLLWLPAPEILLSTKIKSVPNRTEDKRIKDICDIYAISFFSNKKVKELIQESKILLEKDRFEKLKPFLESDDDFLNAAEHLLVDGESIKNLFKELIKT